MKKIISALLFSLFALNAAAQPRVMGLANLIFGQESMARVQVSAQLPLESDLYVLGEQGSKSYNILRVQSYPFKLGNVSFGGAVHTTAGTGFELYRDLGPIAKVQGKVNGVFVKSQTRYFICRGDVNNYSFFDSKRIFGESLCIYNVEKGKLYLQPALDYKVTDRFMIGLEARIMGSLNDPKLKYVAGRVGLTF